MSSEFFCQKCMQHLHVKFLAYRYNNDKHACCNSCDALVKKRKSEKSLSTKLYKATVKLKSLDKKHLDKRRQLEHKNDLKHLDSLYSYSLEDLI